jgi:hypothetical protein
MAYNEPFSNRVEDGRGETGEKGNKKRDGDARVRGDPVLDIVRLLSVGVKDAKDGRRRRRSARFASGRDGDLCGM